MLAMEMFVIDYALKIGDAFLKINFKNSGTMNVQILLIKINYKRLVQFNFTH